MIYRVRDVETADLYEFECMADEAPEHGAPFEFDGKRLVRNFVDDYTLAPPAVIVSRYDNGGARYADGSPCGSRGLGRKFPFAEHRDKKGRPLFSNKRERREAEARLHHAGSLLSAADLSQPGPVEKGRMFLDR